MSAPQADLPPGSESPPSSEAEAYWHRLDPRMLILNVSGVFTPVAGFIATAIVTGGDIPGQAYATLATVGSVFLLVFGAGVLRYISTRYRIDTERVELRSGILVRRYLSIPRDRIRSVDLTANPLHRIFGLTVVKVGTGQTGGSTETNELSLDAVTKAHADELRTVLLAERGTPLTQPSTQPSAEPYTGPATAAAEQRTASAPIATIDWAWLRFAPLTGWTLAVAAILVGGAQRVLDSIGLDPFQTGLAVDLVRWLRDYSILLIVLVALAGILVVGVIGAMVIYVESWWNFRLVREGGVFRVRRGLLTTRSVSLEERRLRGVEVVEPISMRWAGGATTKAVATGFGTSQKDQQKQKDALLPPAPLTVAHRVTAEVLAEDETPVAVRDLTGHPQAALRRRLVRATGVPVLLAAVLAVLSQWITWLPWWAALIALALVLVTIPLAFDAYRNLGHTLTERYLVTRYGTVYRRTVGLRRDGVIGWTISRTYFQRRSGLATVAATTGAGGGEYKIRDVAEGEGLVFADQAVPDLLRPFLVSVQADQQ